MRYRLIAIVSFCALAAPAAGQQTAPSVDWMDAADNYVRLHVGEREYLVRETLASLEAQIDPERFVRVHRSAIVQIDRVAEIRPESHGDAELRLDGGATVAVSRTWRERVQRALAGKRR